jgi:MSHA biogenesis protein MshP
MKRYQQGLGMVTAIIILVILASLASALATFGSTQQMTSAQDVLSVRAWQAAKAGNEWGLHAALNAGTGWLSGSACTPSATVGTVGAQQTRAINLNAELGFSVTVTCSATTFNEGQLSGGAARTVTLYTITSTATNGTAVTSPGYVERTRVVIAEQ